MTELTQTMCAELLASNIPAMVLQICEVSGSAPREPGAMMVVTADHAYGTIGGGRAEWEAMAHARQMIEMQQAQSQISITLGPQIDQCCGGTLKISIHALSEDLLAQLVFPAAGMVLVFGAGPTGLALRQTLQMAGFNVRIADARPKGKYWSVPPGVEVTAVPEQLIDATSSATAAIIATHDHRLDFLITAHALESGKFSYVGMIGSQTKRSVFGSWLSNHDYDPELMAHLTCPIGNDMVKDKRPSTIALATTVELLGVLAE